MLHPDSQVTATAWRPLIPVTTPGPVSIRGRGRIAAGLADRAAVPDEAGFCFTQAFQSIGLGLASAIGAAVARPDRLAVAALGDGGALMGVSELETVVRLKMPMVVVVYGH
jgi:thiamine pyrophosphate-dependent acetolactate synthase large subunit-like protein